MIKPDYIAQTDLDLRKRGRDLARKLGTDIPGVIRIEFWSLPILEALLLRIEKLEEENRKNVNAISAINNSR